MDQPLPKELEPLRLEIQTFLRNLPRLIEEDQEGRYVVIRDDQLFDTWDTYADAVQFGLSKYEDGRFLAQLIDHRFERVLGNKSIESGFPRETVTA